jgi:5-methylcytosine-specific restriction endonuclease McrA
MKAVTGMSIEEFKLLGLTFSKALYQSKSSKKRERAVGGGRKGALVNDDAKLFFILFYLKIYPTYDLGGLIFGVDRSRISRWVNQFLPLLAQALVRVVKLPKRQISSMEEFIKEFPEVKDIFIDATERRTQRPKKLKSNKKRYSGKKKAHTRKNTIISDEHKNILVVSKTREGRVHDLTQLKKMSIVEYIPEDVSLWLDKGYQGLDKYLPNNNSLMIPHKNPRGKVLSSEQKRENSIISGIRIVVEHAICGIKRFGCLTSTYRNRRGQDDQMIFMCSGLWNFHLQYKNI